MRGDCALPLTSPPSPCACFAAHISHSTLVPVARDSNQPCRVKVGPSGTGPHTRQAATSSPVPGDVFDSLPVNANKAAGAPQGRSRGRGRRNERGENGIPPLPLTSGREDSHVTCGFPGLRPGSQAGSGFCQDVADGFLWADFIIGL